MSYVVFELSDPMRFEVDCANSSRQFGDQLSGFGRQSEKFSRIGACIRRNLTPWTKTGYIMYIVLYLQQRCIIKTSWLKCFS